MRIFIRILKYAFLTVFFLFLSFSNARLVDLQDKIHILAVNHAFDFFTWVSQATWIKISQSALNSPNQFTQPEQHKMVLESVDLIRAIENTTHEIDLIYSNPGVSDPAAKSASLRNTLATLNNRLDDISPFVESILEMQVTTILDELGLTTFGQPIPWVLYHVTPLPQNLVISKREKIGAETNYILTPITISEAAALEQSVDQSLNVSSLVVDIGGLAAYPTMIMQTTDLDWLTATIAHEWIHLYLGQRPLGNNYNSSELRTMNETTASIAGNEIGRLVLERYYPELISAVDHSANLISTQSSQPAAAFDFRTEMHTTRITADELLAAGKIDEAEKYMEQRRKFFWDNGYSIRKLNQAYFAFYGSYADTPGGAAGEDPVGPAVRALRKQSASLKEFLEKMSVMTTFQELQDAIKFNKQLFLHGSLGQ